MFSIFDLDVGEAEAESSIARLPELPEKIQQNLRASLSRLMAHEATKEKVGEISKNLITRFCGVKCDLKG